MGSACGVIANITASSNYSLISHNIVSTGQAYLVFLTTTSVAIENVSSVYFLRITQSGTGYITKVFEGTSASTPVLSGNAILNLKSGTTPYTVGYAIHQFV